MDTMIEHNDGTVTWIRHGTPHPERCAVAGCKQHVDGTCQRCGDRLCYDHLVSHSTRKRDYAEACRQVALW